MRQSWRNQTPSYDVFLLHCVFVFFFPPVTAQSICNETNTAFSHKENWEPNVEVFLYPSNISHLLIQIKSNSHLRPDPFRLSIKPISKHDKNFNLQEEATESPHDAKYKRVKKLLKKDFDAKIKKKVKSRSLNSVL